MPKTFYIPYIMTSKKLNALLEAAQGKVFRALALLLIMLLLSKPEVKAQSPFAGLEPLFTEPKHYVTRFAEEAPVIDGNLEDAAWEGAAWTDSFLDIEGDVKQKPAFDTRVKMLWDDTYLFIAAELKEPHVWATLEQRDEIIFHDNDFEVFLSPENSTHQYYEIEVNALNTIFDLFLPKPYRNGGGAMIPWNAEGLLTAVQVQGTLNDPADTDKGWTVEMAIPFRAVTIGNETKVPEEGSLWRVNFSRVEWDTEINEGNYVKKKDDKGRFLPEHNWVWSPQGLINMHYPERWGYLQFTRQKSGSGSPAFVFPYTEKQKNYLWLVYYKQKEYYQKHGKYAKSLARAGLKNMRDVVIDTQPNRLQLKATRHQFMATIQLPEGAVWSINQDGLIRLLKETP
ncbi:carbohydrate binding protein with CBM9 domain [Pontibacter ummariensis]|uniref:Carbohydrate family 9 binding domain-like n=1 Tax=Pontibacter ummariensis TaxID=1610492 RepID=A0A239G2H7_9BACT|nr:carbohydrate-binding family 9-like protein [Pontibacter ummariensis]PRY11686.1 carbohydrate binding protein with CBM9 domain [Pontibacter ummariensis]SNS62908.1 Carbohydrate family 9 binding domain-like [Pontibacter ummariensis]